MAFVLHIGNSLLDANRLPDFVLRSASRAMLASRMKRHVYSLTAEEQLENLVAFAESLKTMPIALDVDAAREEMYEMPPEFFKVLLGKNLKYSSLYFKKPSYNIDQAEDAMLELYCQRAQLKDGHKVLDLGGGFGSLAMFIARKYPQCHVTTLSYSAMHKEYIDKECKKQGLSNVEAINCDISKYNTSEVYDRIFSIEMIEHLKNYQEVFKLISSLMKDDGLLFIEIYCNKLLAYHYQQTEDDPMVTWFAKWFFTGGMIPADGLLLYFQDHISISKHWRMNGYHLGTSCEVWLKRLDDKTETVRSIFKKVYGAENATKWIAYWRTFFIMSAEMFKYNNGQEWMTAHYLFKKKSV